ncbi:MAG: tyrosine-type recombinase/integrase [Hyphomicrobiaceae bacterium]
MLTDAAIRKTKVRERGYYLGDGRGLWLYVSHTGGRYWRFRYQWQGRSRILSLGDYPAMTLEAARSARDVARGHVRAGRDPAVVRQAERARAQQAAGETFSALAREWHARHLSSWTRRHAVDVIHSLERDVFPSLGDVPIREITAPMVLETLRLIEARGAVETAHRVRQRMSAVFIYAIASGRGEADPAAIIEKALAPVQHGRQPAVRTIEEAREILARTESIPGHPVTKLALRILALTAVRPGTLAGTPWTEFADLDPAAPTWAIPASRLKLTLARKRDESYGLLVPLARQTVEAIEVLRTISGESPFAFPNVRGFRRPMSENAMGYMLNRAGYHGRHVPHGWRATFSTVMNERNRADREIIDLMLGHIPRGSVEGAYNRAEHMAERRAIAQAWADLLMAGRPPAAALLAGRRK